jgi:hypothetical protein
LWALFVPRGRAGEAAARTECRNPQRAASVSQEVSQYRRPQASGSATSFSSAFSSARGAAQQLISLIAATQKVPSI